MRQILVLFIALVALMIGSASATYTTMTPVTMDSPNDWGRMTASWTAIAGNGSTCNFAVDGSYDYFLLVNITSWDVTDATLDYLSVMAGDNPPAFRSDIGNMTLTMDDMLGAGTVIVGPLESARFMNSTGYINIGSYMIDGYMTVLKQLSV
ncbi:MAG: hypothetical protein PHD64_05895 [Mesotoga sp.]|nr:hypothetical protein [Mesotoga sp.]